MWATGQLVKPSQEELDRNRCDHYMIVRSSEAKMETPNKTGYGPTAFVDFFEKIEGTRWTNEHHGFRWPSVESGAKSRRHS